SAQVTRQRSFTRVLSQVNEGGAPPTAAGASERVVETTSTAPGVSTPSSDVRPAPGPAEYPVEGSTGALTRGADRPVRRDCEPAGAEREIRLAGPVPWLQPGASYRLTPAIVDASGCVASKGPFTYAVEPAVDAVRVGLKSGRIQIAPHAPEG